MYKCNIAYFIKRILHFKMAAMFWSHDTRVTSHEFYFWLQLINIVKHEVIIARGLDFTKNQACRHFFLHFATNTV